MKPWSVVLPGTLICLLAASLLVASPARAREADDDIPGVPIPASPVQGYLDANADRVDVYSLSMRKGDRLRLVMNGQSSMDNPQICVYGPGSMGVQTTDPVAGLYCFDFPGVLRYTATTGGTHYVAVAIWFDDWDDYGNYTLAWTNKSPTITRLTTKSKTITAGRSTEVAGVLKYAFGDAGIADKTARLEASRTGSKWTKVKSKKTSATGTFSFTVRPAVSRYYRVRFTGTTSFLASKSARIRITVR